MFADDAQCGAMLSSMWSERPDEAAQHDKQQRSLHYLRLRALGGIDHRPIVANDGAGCQARYIDMRFPENVLHLLACGEKVVGDDPAVAAPPNRFGAHDYASMLTAVFPKQRQPRGERGRQGIVRVVLKAAHSPIGIGRGLSAARLSPEAAELGDMLVADLPRRERIREALLIELWVSARPRH